MICSTKKLQLRARARELVGGLSLVERRRQSEAVMNKLLKHPKYLEASNIAIYLSTDNEIDTIPILQHALEEAGKQCFIPLVKRKRSHDGLGTRMIMVRLNSMSCYERLPVNHYGIKEPDRLADDDLIAKPAESNLDLAIVPGVAFARDGRRLGHGKGYYDEFLSNWASETSKRLYTIGVAFDKQIFDDVPTSAETDYIMDEILTA